VDINIHNPLPELVEDSDQVRDLIRDLKLRPPYGTVERSAISWMNLFDNLYQSAASHGNCINTKLFYAFEGELEIVQRFLEGLKVPEEMLDDIDYKQQLDFATKLNEMGIPFSKITDITKELAKSEDVQGNAYLRYRQIEVGGTKRVSLKYLKPQHCMYLFEEEATTICIAKEWTKEGFEKYGYELVRAFPNWTEKKGYRETIFHIKNGSDLYGRPEYIQVLRWLMVEWFTSDTMMKVSQSELTSIILFLMKAPPAMVKPEENEDKEFQIAVNSLRRLMTREGSGKSIVAIEYSGDTPPQTEKLAINRDSKYNEFALNTASSYIHASHDVPKEISRMVQTSSGIGSNILKDLFNQFDFSVIQPLQMRYERFWQKVIDETLAFFGQNDELGIRFDRTIDRMVDILGAEAVVTPEQMDEGDPAKKKEDVVEEDPVIPDEE